MTATDVHDDDVEFAVGTVLHGGARTVTDAELALLPAMMGAINPLFHDEVTARKGPMGGRILYGPALLGIAVALTEPLLKHRVMGLVEIGSVRFWRPVRSGDTVRASLEIVSCRRRQNRSGLLLNVADQIHNQDGESVLTFTRAILIAERMNTVA